MRNSFKVLSFIIGSVLSTLKLRVVSVVRNQSSLLQRRTIFCRSDLRIATFTRKISVDSPVVYC